MCYLKLVGDAHTIAREQLEGDFDLIVAPFFKLRPASKKSCIVVKLAVVEFYCFVFCFHFEVTNVIFRQVLLNENFMAEIMCKAKECNRGNNIFLTF